MFESGQIEDGQDISGQNAKEKNTGRKHSNWLSFMYPRLVLARELLREDGVIFVSIDDNEVHHLRQIMNEIFGEEEFLSEIVWHSKYTTSNDINGVSGQHEYILSYVKDSAVFNIGLLDRTVEMDSAYKNPDNDPKGNWKATPLHAKSGSGNYELKFPNGVIWTAPQGRYPRYNKDKLMQMFNEGRLWFGKDGNKIPDAKTYLSEVKQGKTPGSIISYKDVGSSHEANEELAKIVNKGIFDNPKPVSLIKHLLQISTSPNDLILDFFAGSGTTGQAVMELNQEEIDKQAKDGLLADKEAEVGGRRFILVQLPEKIDNKKEAFKFCKNNNLEPVISNITIERIRRAGEKYKSVDNGFKVLQLTESIINRKFMNTINATKEEIFAEIACSYGYGLNYQYRDLHNLGKGITYLKGNNRQALIILGEEQMNNQTLAEIVLYSDHLKECQIFAQDACLNVEIIHNLYQHFEQKRVVIV